MIWSIRRWRETGHPLVMHPLLFVAGATTLGVSFAVQEWVAMARFWPDHHVDLWLLVRAWGAQYFLWGVLCWLLWRMLWPRIMAATVKDLLLVFLPLSLVCCVVEEAVWVALFPHLPTSKPHLPYAQRLSLQLNEEIINSLVIFWSAFFLFRGIGYYVRLKEKEQAEQRLQSQLVSAQLRALRMQLNPHFLFNTMNSISSLMQTDVPAADLMLEQLSRLLRITLHRGESQLIPLSDEMEFIEMYLAMQDKRFAGRVTQQVTVDPALHDALVPAMILQPVVENAYAHGVARMSANGRLTIEAAAQGSVLLLSVTNNGAASHNATAEGERREGNGVGLANVRERLRMHYGDDHMFSMKRTDGDCVQVVLGLPLRFRAVDEEGVEQTTGYGV